MILKNPSSLETYSHDECHGIKPVMPAGVFKPKNTREVQEFVRKCKQEGTPITARGGGTGKAGACVPTPGAMVIDFSGMNQILDISPENLTARVQPGVLLRDFRDAAHSKGLLYPPDPSSLTWCTLGGNVATNAAGPSSLKYGCTRDYVLGLEVVTAPGDILKLGKQTVKGVAGYDLVSLVCGSEGTLALVTEITLKLLPLPRAQQTVLLSFGRNEQALEAINSILQAGYLPRTLEYMDAKTMLGNPALLIEYDGDDSDALLAVVESMVNLVKPIGLESSEVALDESQRRSIWEKRRLMSKKLKKRFEHKISEDIAVPRGQIERFAREFDELGLRYGVETAIFGHAGDGNLHAQLLFDEAKSSGEVDRILKELFEITLRLNGTISGEHGIGLAKKPYLMLEQSKEVIALQKAIKAVWDPNNLLNPDKIFDSP
ncbi:MAG: FAD-binding protein [Deltaproteobacteria bacterium]|nr:FAD-binding protein [Deltaproteobacteria bacterium]